MTPSAGVRSARAAPALEEDFLCMTAARDGSTWQQLKRAWCHDWLENTFIRGLNAWLVNFKAERPTAFEPAQGADPFLAKWESERSAPVRLLDHFECDMTPRILLERPPLAACPAETKAWLGPLLHALWMTRRRVTDRLERSRSAVSALDRAVSALRAALAAQGEGAGVRDGLSRCVEAARDLLEQLRQLALEDQVLRA